MQVNSKNSSSISGKSGIYNCVDEISTLDRYHPDVSVLFDPSKGAMLIARRNFSKSETIVSALTCRVPYEVRKEVKNFDFHKYFFVNFEEFRNSGHCCDGFIAFGPMSFCNHSDNPNAEVAWENTNDRTILHLRAREPVPENSEITMRYANLPEYIGFDQWK